jgi:dipeptidyl aminopeptidase/acylaminoacyl peptidase
MEGWNYLHPNFRGANSGPDNCLSDKVIADIDDAIAYGVRNGNVDPDNVFIVGFSGGAYAAVGVYARGRQRIRAVLAWAPIVDLASWHDELMSRGNPGLARSIRLCTGSGDQLLRENARQRSPLFWALPPAPRARIELFAGIKDGYTGTVPIAHSLRMFNRLAEAYGSAGQMLTSEEMLMLVSRGADTQAAVGSLAGRAVLFRRESVFGSVTVFDGSHEILAEACMDRLKRLVVHRP